MEQDLKKLGLTDNEIKAYLSLLKLGETAVGGLVKDLKIHRQIIYNALDSLEKRNMVIKTKKNLVYHFRVTDPRIIAENIKKQELIANRLIHSIKNELKRSRHEQEISVYDGRDKIRQFFINQYKQCPTGSAIYILAGAPQKLAETIGDKFFYGEYEKIRTRRKIVSKYLVSELFKKDLQNILKQLDKKLRQIKYLPYNSISPVTTVIWPDSISFQSFFGEPFIIEIKNNKFRESYLEHFNLLWKMGKR